jgi:glutaredoxin
MTDVKLKVYGKQNCGNCISLKNILDNNKIEYEYSDNQKELMKIGSATRIMSAPIVEYDGKYYTMQEIIKILNIV